MVVLHKPRNARPRANMPFGETDAAGVFLVS